MSARPICMAPFGALSIAANGDVSPCCQYVGNVGSLRQADLATLWQGEGMQALRQDMRDGNKPKACWKCWQAEDAGEPSLRQRLNSAFAAQTQDDPAQRPVYLDFRYSNLCNFRCRTCHHGASSRWFADAKAMGTLSGDAALLTAFDSAADGLAQFDAIGDKVTSLYFAGGEPLLEAQNAALLVKLIEDKRTDIVLSYNTNLSILDVDALDLTALWQHFPKLHIETSIDAIGAGGALIRRGFSWDDYRKNIARLRETCPHAILSAGITVSALNLLHLPELFHALHNDCGFGFDALHIHALQMPQHYDIAILPDIAKERAAIRLEALAREVEAHEPGAKNPAKLRQLIKRLDPASIGMDDAQLASARIKFAEVTQQLDDLRHEDTAATLPELAPLMGTKIT